MYAIVRQGNKKYYTSTVFGYFHDIKSEDDHQRYLERIHSPYYIVWNEKKTHLIKVFAMQPNTKYLIPQIQKKTLQTSILYPADSMMPVFNL